MKGEEKLLAYSATLADAVLASARKEDTTTLREIVDGVPAAFVASTLSRSVRRTHGIFFSGADWAGRIAAVALTGTWQRFIDPSAGTGDLLLAVCRQLPLAKDVKSTIAQWSQRIGAHELRTSFLRIAWKRIVALALLRHAENGIDGGRLSNLKLPTSFTAGDTLRAPIAIAADQCLVMNPPFQQISAPRHSQVGAGLVSAAALHIEHVTAAMAPGAGLVALLPDVLRSGSRYRRFRELVESRATIESFEPLGRFGPSADVDVALLIARAGRVPQASPICVAPNGQASVGHHFAVRVGPVVPHRTKRQGAAHPYLSAGTAPRFGRVVRSSDKHRFNSSPIEGPMVVVRRTSSPKDRARAVPTVVLPKGPFYVENHLLVCKPLSGRQEDCELLMARLSDPRTNDWLNHRIRCRHLTVSAICDLPWWDLPQQEEDMESEGSPA